MSFNACIQPMGSYLKVAVSGTIESGAELLDLARLLRMSREYGLPRILLDERRLKKRLDALDLYQAGESCVAAEAAAMGTRQACLPNPDDLELAKTLETMLRNRLVNFRVFGDEAGAVDWLTAGSIHTQKELDHTPRPRLPVEGTYGDAHMNIFTRSVPFYKMQGCGNDFVVIDNRELGVPQAAMADWAKGVCARAFGVCADGLFFLEDSDDPALDYRWHFYNSDGSRAEMCGNASRCAGKLAHALGLAPAEHVFGTDAGPIKAKVLLDGPDQGRVKVQLTPPKGIETGIALDVDGSPLTAHFADTGVPHAVVFVDDVEAVDIMDLGPKIRYHERFAPAGTNVNFAQVKDRNTMLLRTYERGVEAETYACGTGASAAQLLANALGLTGSRADLTTTGGEVLTVFLEDGNVFLQGNAELTFRGELYLAPLGLTL